MPMILAVVEIGGVTALLLLLGGIVLVSMIGAGLWLLLRTVSIRRSDDGGYEIQAGGRLPVSARGFDRIAQTTAAAIERPALTPERRERLHRLTRLRARLLMVYRVAMLLIGLGGIAFAAILFRDATPGNMLALPAGLILLLSSGALLEAALPRLWFRDVAPVDAALRDRLTIQVTRADPHTLSIDEGVLQRVREATGQGFSLEEAARDAYPEFDSLDAFEKRAVLDALAALLRQT